MDILEWIQRWFTNHCNGVWEQGEGIQITTLDNPAWEVEIDISNTSIANVTVDKILNETSTQDWYSVKIENQKFTATGDSGKLIFLLGLFREMIEKIENS